MLQNKISLSATDENQGPWTSGKSLYTLWKVEHDQECSCLPQFIHCHPRPLSASLSTHHLLSSFLFYLCTYCLSVYLSISFWGGLRNQTSNCQCLLGHKAMVFPVVTYGCESWTVKKAEHWRTDAFELWCWRRLWRVPWPARRSNQSILKEISPEYLLEGLMLKLKLQYFGHLM